MKPLRPLLEGDLAVCKMFAALRTAANRRNGVERPFSTGFEKHIAQEESGVIAEYAFCKHFNLFFNGAFGGKDSGIDCTLHGNKIDIKSITDKSLNLLAHAHTDKSLVDVYVLCYVDGAQVYIVGWTSKDDFIREENLTDLGHGPSYLMIQSDLKVWE